MFLTGDSSTYTVPLILIGLHVLGWLGMKYWLLASPQNVFEKITAQVMPWIVTCSIIVIVHVSFSDPGIHLLNPDKRFKNLSRTGERLKNYGKKGIVYQDQTTGQRYIFKCRECRVFRMLDSQNRADGKEVDKIVHCEDCGVCVTGYDHHCGVLGTCIGSKNVASFYIFPLVAILCFGMFYIALISGLTVASGGNTNHARPN